MDPYTIQANIFLVLKMHSTESPPKKDKGVKTGSETELSCCTKQILNCVQEMGD